MNCPSCAKPLPANASKCPACGKAASLLPDTYDLLPEDPPKKAEADPFALPPDLLNAPPPPAAPAAGGGAAKPARAPMRPTDWSPHTSGFEVNKGMIIAGSLMLLVIGGMAWKTCGPEPSEVKGRGAKIANWLPFQLASGRWQTISFEVKGEATFKYEVAADEGQILMGYLKRSPTERFTLELLKAKGNLVPVSPGTTRTLEGQLDAGRWDWVVYNEDKKAVRGRMKYLAEPD